MASLRSSWIVLVIIACNAASFVESGSVSSSRTSHQAMVAFTCHMPAMHLTGDGWKKDDSTDCILDPQAILQYCRKMYPSLDIRNVVEASTSVSISDWCPFGKTRCHNHVYTVRPYRCLVGPFQSDALLVPRTCLFDHIHDSRTCQSYDAWNQTAIAACVGRGLVQQSFAIMQPCAVDRFSGAEFVCCPASTSSSGAESVVSDDDDEDEDDDDDMETDPPVILLSTPRHESTAPATEPTTTTTTTAAFHDVISTTTAAPSDDGYMSYMLKAEDVNKTEHEVYQHARADLEKRHHTKVAKMMKEWAAAHQRVQEMKAIDGKGADKLNRQITARFQKMYESLEKEGVAENKQLGAVHQQRVQAELNEQKRHAMEVYMTALSEEQPSALRVIKALKHYIKIEQKDRIHMITHYQRVQQTDPVEAEAIFSYVADHLRVIDQRLTQALDMLNRVPKQEKKIRQHIEEFLSTYHSFDESLAVILAKMAERSSLEADVTTTTLTSSSTITQSSSSETTKAATDKTSDTSEITSKQDNENGGEEVSWTPMISTLQQMSKMAASEGAAVSHSDSKFDRFDDGVMESREDYIQIRTAEHVAHLVSNEGNGLQQMSIKKLSISGQKSDTVMYLATPLGIAMCSIALMVIITIGIIVLRKRVCAPPAVSGELRDVTSMSPGPAASNAPSTALPPAPAQMNGYENPTHKYLEQKAMEP